MMESEPFITGEDRLREIRDRSRTDAGMVHRNRRINQHFWSLFALKLCISFTQTLLELPMLRLVERKICLQGLPGTAPDAPELVCKTPAVQDKLAHVVGLKSTFDALPCLLTALTYGAISNRFGRKLIMRLSIIGQALALTWILMTCLTRNAISVEYMWLASLFLLLGGGIRVELSMLYTSFCDVVPRTKRVKYLSYLHASDGIAGLLGYPLGSILMKWQLLSPFGTAFAFYLARLAALLFIQETSPCLVSEAHSPSPTALGIRETGTSDDELATGSAAESLPVEVDKLADDRWNSILSKSQISKVKSLCRHNGLRIVFLMFLVKRIGFASEPFALQYTSETLGKTLSDTFWLRTLNNLGMLLALAFFVPALSRWLTSPVKEIWVIRASLIDIIVGFLIVWQARTFSMFCIGLIICGLGEGLEVGLQSIGSYIVGEVNFATFFPFVGMLGVMGELIGGPSMAWLYAIRGEDKLPAAYCFLFSATLFTGLLISSLFIILGRI